MHDGGSPLSAAFLQAAGALCKRLEGDDGRELVRIWRSAGRNGDEAVRVVDHELSRHCQSRASAALVSSSLPRGVADIAMLWAESASARPELLLSPLLSRDNAARVAYRARAARARLLEGPLLDALLALPSAWDDELGTDGWLRLRQLLWEAGARGLSLPGLGRWLIVTPRAASQLIVEPARGHLGARVLAARSLASVAEGFEEDLAPSLSRELLAVAAGLREHAEPLVWIPAARGLGRFALGSQSARVIVFRASTDERLSTRRRNIVSIASMPTTMGAEGWVREQFELVLDEGSRKDDPWRLPAMAIATPQLARERPDIWDRLVNIALEAPSIELAWSIAQGLASLARQTGGLATDERRVASKLAEQLQALRPSATSEISRKLEALLSLERARGVEPSVKSCFDRFDYRLRGDLEGVAVAEPEVPRVAFDDAVASLNAVEDEERGAAQMALRAATRTHALHLPGLVLGLRTLDADTQYMMHVCRERLAAEICEYGLRATLVGGVGDLVAGDEAHGRVAAEALRAIAGARWVVELGEMAVDASNTRQVRKDIQRFRKPLEDLFETCLSTRPALAHVREDVTVPPVLAGWWALCAGPSSVLGNIDRRSREQGNALEHRINRLETVLRDAAHLSARIWGPRALEALHDLDAKDTALSEGLARLIEVLGEIEAAQDADEEEAERLLAKLAAACRAFLALGENLDDAFAAPGASVSARMPGWISAPRGTAMTLAPVLEPAHALVAGASWDRLAPALRALAAPLARALMAKVTASQRFLPAPGIKLGRYDLIDRISGPSGMGEVWRAAEVGVDQAVRRVAIKFPKPDAPKHHRELFAKALLAEAKVQFGFSGAGVLTMLDFGHVGGVPYLVSELLRGKNVEQYLINDDAAEPTGRHLRLVQRIVEDICMGLGNLHDHGVVHRDLKPANVMLRMNGRFDDPIKTIADDPDGDEIHGAVLIDLGIAHKIWETGKDGATIGYAAPELFDETPVGPPADVYALGATLFHILARRPLTGNLGPVPGMSWHLTVEPADDPQVRALTTSMPARFREAIFGACKLVPAQRISLREFRNLCRF